MVELAYFRPWFAEVESVCFRPRFAGAFSFGRAVVVVRESCGLSGIVFRAAFGEVVGVEVVRPDFAPVEVLFAVGFESFVLPRGWSPLVNMILVSSISSSPPACLRIHQ